MDGSPVITLELKESPYSRAMWDYSFQALYKVNIFFAILKPGSGRVVELNHL